MARLALITGGTRGIGAAIAQRLDADGLRVAVTYHGNEAAAQEFAAHHSIPVYKWDVTDFDACRNGIERVEADFGQAVDVLVNNAGITRDAMLHKMSVDQWREVVDDDLGACFNMCRNLIHGMRERGWGRIVNISSINALKGQLGQTNYAAAKAGVIGFSKSLALESARKGITVNAIAPGYIATDMVQAMDPQVLAGVIAQIPVGRLGAPDEIAHAVSFLVDERAAFLTGATLSINGGQYLS